MKKKALYIYVIASLSYSLSLHASDKEAQTPPPLLPPLLLMTRLSSGSSSLPLKPTTPIKIPTGSKPSMKISPPAPKTTTPPPSHIVSSSYPPYPPHIPFASESGSSYTYGRPSTPSPLTSPKSAPANVTYWPH